MILWNYILKFNNKIVICVSKLDREEVLSVHLTGQVYEGVQCIINGFIPFAKYFHCGMMTGIHWMCTVAWRLALGLYMVIR